MFTSWFRWGEKLIEPVLMGIFWSDKTNYASEFDNIQIPQQKGEADLGYDDTQTSPFPTSP